ncbi:MAG: hypothetical protein IJ795_02120 [Bacteroidales bacterium]|nr:hypothetical protein [Bacteroidales bacterium]
MTFSDIIGNEGVVSALRNMVDTGRIPHAMMLYENDGCGAMAIVQAFLQYLACTRRHDGEPCGECLQCRQVSKAIYAGVRYTFPVTSGTKVGGAVKDLTCDMFSSWWKELLVENPYFTESELSTALGFEKKSGLIAVAEGKAILQKLSIASATDGYRTIVIYLPEKMNVQTANMLLKAIEEPAEGTLFVMVTHSPESVLQTISSRCQAIRVLPLEKEQVRRALVERFSCPEEDASIAASLSGGSIGMALRYLRGQEEASALEGLVIQIFTSLLERDLYGLLEKAEEAAALDSRERQKAFCSEAGAVLRQIFMVQQGMEDLAMVPPSQRAFIAGAARRLAGTFPRKAMDIVSRAGGMIDRNVNQKAVFTNMADSLFMSL